MLNNKTFKFYNFCLYLYNRHTSNFITYQLNKYEQNNASLKKSIININ